MRNIRNSPKNKPYTEEIDAPWVLEVLLERFDNAIELMPDNCVVYGGAVRDALAELPLLGDLDIAAGWDEEMVLRGRLADSVKWRQSVDENIKLPSTRPPVEVMHNELAAFHREPGESNNNCIRRIIHTLRDKKAFRNYSINDAVAELYNKLSDNMPTKKNYGSYVPERYKTKSPTSYGDNIPSAIPISRINTYKGIDGVLVQIMKTKKAKAIPGITVNNFDETTQVARMVDIMCCGVVMDKDGKVFEVIKGAYEDCKNKVLNINPVIVDESLNIANLETRVLRLIERGWSSEVPLEELKIEVEELKVASKRKAKAKYKRTQQHKKKEHKHIFDQQVVDKFMNIKFNDALGDDNAYDSYVKSFTAEELNTYYNGSSEFVHLLRKRAAAFGIEIDIKAAPYGGASTVLTHNGSLIARATIRNLYTPMSTNIPEDSVKHADPNGYKIPHPEAALFENYTVSFDLEEIIEIFGTLNVQKVTDILISRCNHRNVIVNVTRYPGNDITQILFSAQDRGPMTTAEINNFLRRAVKRTSAPKYTPAPASTKKYRTKGEREDVTRKTRFSIAGRTVANIGGRQQVVSELRQLLEGFNVDYVRNPDDSMQGIIVYYNRNDSIVGTLIRGYLKKLNPSSRPSDKMRGRPYTPRRTDEEARAIKKAFTVKSKLPPVNTYDFSSDIVARNGGVDALAQKLESELDAINVKSTYALMEGGMLRVTYWTRSPGSIDKHLDLIAGIDRPRKPMKKQPRSKAMEIKFNDTF